MLSDYEFVGELALTGALRGVSGRDLAAAMAALQAGRQMVLAEQNQQDVGLIQQGETLVGKHLVEICAFLHNQTALTVAHYQPETVPHEAASDLSDIIGQEQGRRALEITAAGGHNLLLIGPPGTGKTMLASRLSGIIAAA